MNQHTHNDCSADSRIEEKRRQKNGTEYWIINDGDIDIGKKTYEISTKEHHFCLVSSSEQNI